MSAPLLRNGCSFFHPIVYFEKGPMKPGVMTDIHVTKPLKPTNFNFPKWQTESFIPSKIINEILIWMLGLSIWRRVLIRFMQGAMIV